MGADKPHARRRTPYTSKPQIPVPFLLLGVLFLWALVALFQPRDVTGEYNAPKLSPKEEAQLEKRLQEIDDAEQYGLIALEDGWYPCKHPGRVAVYLLAGEIWKYGTTTKGQVVRYSLKYLTEINVYYFIQFKGTISECLKEEQRKLFNYPYLPENVARPMKDRLPLPPGNSKKQ